MRLITIDLFDSTNFYEKNVCTSTLKGRFIQIFTHPYDITNLYIIL